MGLLSSILKTAVDVVTLPVSIAKDVDDFISGEDSEESETVENIKDLIEDIL